MSFTSHYLTCAGHEIHYTEWGAAQSPVAIAWHGLARTGRDMDELAAVLSPDRWLLWLGLPFVLSVYHFPTGVVGRLRAVHAQGTTKA